MLHKFITAILVLVLAVATGASALPTTNPVVVNSANQVTFSAAGAAGTGWFAWGGFPGGPYYWTTPNQTVSGAFSDTQYGPPMLTGTTYYVVSCDSTGCGNEVSFFTMNATNSNQTHFGQDVITIQRTGMNVTATTGVLVKPYTQTMTAPIAWGLLFFFILTGMWLRPRDIFLPCIMAMIVGGVIWFGPTALGVPPEWSSLGQGLMYAAIAGIAFSWFTH